MIKAVIVSFTVLGFSVEKVEEEIKAALATFTRRDVDISVYSSPIDKERQKNGFVVVCELPFGVSESLIQTLKDALAILDRNTSLENYQFIMTI